jgi:tetratricopeptide (TPR) repeat protein/predicted Ser/Thr protein kinase
MGVVYLATDPLLRRTVAIKVLPGGDDEIRERFGREARSAASLRHNNVVTIYDVGENDDQPFIAMEFLDGESMHEVIQRKASVPLDRRLTWMIELCAGLSHAHRSGVIHRDIKPGNLMITTEGSLKILDFGLARITSGANQTGLTRAGAIMGTPHYMSPEQVTGETVDHRSDIFSVGLVLYELLSYSKAFSGDSAPVVLHNILHKTPAPIRSLLPDIDTDLEAVINRAIEKERDKRYQDLATFGSELARVRTRLARNSDEATQRQPAASPPKGSLDPTIVRPYRNLDALAQRRASQIASYIHAAMKQFEGGNYEGAIAECENALLLNPQEGPALELIDRAHRAVEDANVNRWLEEARALMTGGDLTAAEALIDQSLKLRADSTGAQALQRELREKRRERERNAERQRSAQSAISRARGHLGEGAFEAAIRCASEALGYDPNNAEARSLKDQAAAAIAEREVKERAKAERNAATAAIEQSRTMLAKGDAQAALTMLKSFRPQELVNSAIRDLENQVRQQSQVKRPEPLSTESIDVTMQVAPEFKPEPPKPRRESAKPIAPVERGLPMPAIAAAVVVVLLAGGAGWYFLGSSAPEPQATDGATVLPAEDLSAVINTARGQYRTGDSRGALATLVKIPAGNKEAEDLAATIRGVASMRTASARQAADAAKKNGADAYRQAVEKQDAAAALGTTLASADRVVALLDEATTLFGVALKTESPSNAGNGGQGGTTGVATNGTSTQGAGQTGAVGPTLSDAQRREVARLVAEGQRQLNDGDYEASIAAYEAALRIDPTSSRATNGVAGVRKAQAAEAAALAGLKKKPGA